MARQGVPRGPLTPLGRALEERNISALAMAKAIAIAERKPRLDGAIVKYYMYGQLRPNAWRQHIMAQLLKLPVEELFPPLHKPGGRAQPFEHQELSLLEAAKQLTPEPPGPSAEAQSEIDRASAQQKLPKRDVPGDNTVHGARLHVMSTGAKRRRKTPTRKPRSRGKVAA